MAAIERWDPFREMLSLRNTVNHLFDEALVRPGEWLGVFREGPALDMYETDGVIKVDVPLPGVQPEEVEVTLSGNTLTIKGEHKTKEEVKEEHFYRHEVRCGAFARSVTLPESVDVEKPEATFENGVLSITFPKVATVQPKHIEVKK